MFKFWRDERAFVITAELTLIATILGVGVLAGLASVRDQSLQELGDLAAAIGDVNESYCFLSVTSPTAWTAGSMFVDQRDFCDQPVGDLNGSSGEACIDVNASPTIDEGVARPTIDEGVARPGNPEA